MLMTTKLISDKLSFVNTCGIWFWITLGAYCQNYC